MYRVFCRALGQLRDFRRSEVGAFSVLSMLMILGIILASSVGIVVMRHEAKRSHLQASIDTSVLAAASSINTFDPRDVVNNYLETAGIDLNDIDTFQATTTGARTVTVAATSSLDPLFSFWDQPLAVPAAATATEALGDMEISLVLDDSGSMAGSKISELVTAASLFYDTVLTPDRVADTTISVIPFGSSVYIGQPMFDALGIVANVPDHHCVEFRDLDFASTAMPTGPIARQQFYPAAWGWVSSGLDDVYACEDSAGLPLPPVVYFENNVAALKLHLNTLQAYGTTHADVGAKWGLALLSPANRAIIQANAASIGAAGIQPDRPADFGGNTTKIMIIMTDGKIQTIDRDADSTANSRSEADLQRQCDLARLNDVIVYTISFDTDGDLAAKQQMRDCASDPSFFFDASVGGLDAVFSQIGQQVTKLRLTR